MPCGKIFLYAVSGQFKACRDALASELRAIGCEWLWKKNSIQVSLVHDVAESLRNGAFGGTLH